MTTLIDGFDDILLHIRNQEHYINKLKEENEKLKKENEKLKKENDKRNNKIDDVSINEFEVLGISS